MRLRFVNKANREAAAKAYKMAGYDIRRSSVKNQVLSPDSVSDFEGTPAPNGYGGSAPEFFDTIYKLDVAR